MSTGVEAAEGVDASGLRRHAQALERELGWFGAVLQARLAQHFGQPHDPPDPRQIPAPAFDNADSELARLVARLGLGWAERLVLALALAPHLRPQELDLLFVRNANLDRGYTEFGGWKGRSHGGFLPTGETAALLVAGEDVAERIALLHVFGEDHAFRRENILRLEHDAPGEPYLSGALVASSEVIDQLCTGSHRKPDFSQSFPAKLITTRLTWDDLVLGPDVWAEIATIRGWMQHAPTLMDGWGLARTLKPGYRSLFFGPPGTGKTLTATLIGQAAGADVYRIDLSMMVSKYIGETEKNLARVFDQAQHREWILFFDEADALFSKRTATSSSNDRHANQEVSYLLQRVEDFPGHVILATNLKNNIDDAFTRRFQSIVHFPMPDAEQRERLWRGMLAEQHFGDIDVKAIAERYELSGGAIANVVRYGAICAAQRGEPSIAVADLVRGVVRELRKEGRTV
jgi:hypothetical protein